MPNSDIQFATPDQVDWFMLLFCDTAGPPRLSKNHERINVAAQLVAEYYEEDNKDLGTVQNQRRFVADSHIVLRLISEIADSILAGQALTASDYMKYAGAYWRTIPEDEIRKSYEHYPGGPEPLNRILEERRYHHPRSQNPHRTKFQSLGVVD